MDNKYYVYACLDLTKKIDQYIGSYYFQYEPIYIGKGTGQRIYSHLRPSSLYSRDTYFYRHLRKLETKDVSFIKIKEDLKEIEAFELEKYLIEKIGRKCESAGPLYNITSGGEGTSGRISPMKGLKHSEETKQKISANSRHLKPMLGRAHTQEEKDNLSEKLKGIKRKPFSKEHIEKLRTSHLEKKQSELSKAKRAEALTKKIRCEDTGEIFESAEAVALRFGITASCIRTACRTSKKAVNHYWTYYNKIESKEEDGSS